MAARAASGGLPDVLSPLKIFDYPMLLTQGGPGNATETVAVYLWRVGWEFARVSHAAAMSLIFSWW